MEAILYAEIYLICLFVCVLLLYRKTSSDGMSTQSIWFRRVVSSFTLSFLFNLLFTLFNRIFVIEALVIPLSYILKTLHFVAMAFGVYCWCCFVETTLQSGPIEKKHTQIAIYATLVAVLAIPTVNVFYHWMFDFGESYAYQRHFMYHAEIWLLFAMSLVYSFRLLRMARKQTDQPAYEYMRTMSTFPISLLIAAILSYMGEKIPIMCVCVTLELLCLYVDRLKRDVSMDRLTQVNNRHNLTGFLDYKLKHCSGQLYLLLIDVDSLKSINDSFGHLEGDNALVTLAGVLKHACGSAPMRPYIARYGGDEFIIVMEGSSADAENLKTGILDILSDVNESLEYNIGVSIGYAEWKPGMDYKQWIAAADSDMYEIKRTKKQTCRR